MIVYTYVIKSLSTFPVDLETHCAPPMLLEHGYYTCQPNNCNLFKAGTIIQYACEKEYRLEPRNSSSEVTCGTDSQWHYGNRQFVCEYGRLAEC